MNENLLEQLALLPDYLGRHLVLSMLALTTGIAISIPLGVLVRRRTALESWVLLPASMIQTVPGLAFLALMVALLGRIGFVPAYLAITLYSILPILRNTATGLAEVDAGVLEAARGIGMTPWQQMFKVQLPLAAPTIIAGIRTATVWTVGLTTLSTPVGATSLGNYIFSGLQTQNNTALLVGCAAIAALALILDGAIRWIEIALERRSPRRALAAAVGLLVLLAAGMAPVTKDFLAQRDEERVVVAGKGFTEQYILAQFIGHYLEQNGYAVNIRENMGSSLVLEALLGGEVDLYVEYSGTAWANAMKRKGNPGKTAVSAAVTEWMQEQGAAVVGSLGFENRYALAMRRDHAARLGIRSIDDLVSHARRMSIASDYEFFSRPEWISLREAYQIDFADKRSMDAALMYPAIAQEQVEVITAYTTDGRIDAFDLVLLDDPREALLPYDGMLIASPEAQKNAALMATLAPLANALTNDTMRTANKMVDVDGLRIDEAVDYLLEQLAQ